MPYVYHLLKFTISKRSLPYSQESFFLLSWGSISEGVVCEGDGGIPVDSIGVWYPYIVPGVSQAVFFEWASILMMFLANTS